MGRSSFPPQNCEKLWILDAEELHRTVLRLCSQVIESVANPKQLLLLGIPTRGVALAQVLAAELQIQPDFVGRVVPTSRQEFIHLMLQEVDGEEGVVLLKPPTN
ncbi:MAG: hypothetical protein EB119_07615 [Synechococcaceae bacterium WBB_34_004]|nr:hypothetical protein [Synechococcaceae bacterium WBB_34_004]